MVGPIDVKRKGSTLVWYWVQYVIMTFDLTHDLELGCLKVKFRNSSISGIVGLVDVRWKGSELIWYWADCMTLPFDHTIDLDLGVSRSESEIALSQEWGGRLTINEKVVSHPFMTMILTCVTMVGWADVPDSDRGDFRRRRVIDYFSENKTFASNKNSVWFWRSGKRKPFDPFNVIPIRMTTTQLSFVNKIICWEFIWYVHYVTLINSVAKYRMNPVNLCSFEWRG